MNPVLEVPKDLRIHPSELVLSNNIGEGSYGTVWKGTMGITDVAVKKLTIGCPTPPVLRGIKKEFETLAALHHPNVLQIYGVCIFSDCEYWIVMPYADGGSLYARLSDNTEISWEVRRRWIKEAASGVAFLHKKGVIHRDLKSPNFLLIRNMIKLCDFGMATTDSAASTMVTSAGSIGTVRWLAPECTSMDPDYNYASDIYGLGMVMWEIAARDIPFKGFTDNEVIAKVKLGERPPIPSDCPDLIARVISMCWAQEADERPTADEVVTLLQERTSMRTSSAAGFRELETRADETNNGESRPIELDSEPKMGATASLNKQISNLQASNETLTQTIRRMEHEYGQLNMDNVILMQDAEQYKKRYDKVFAEKTAMGDHITNLQASNQELSQSIKVLESELDKIRQSTLPRTKSKYQQIVHTVGNNPEATSQILLKLANHQENKLHYECVILVYLQLTQWNIIESKNLPVLQAVITGLSNLIPEDSIDLFVLTHALSKSALLLYMLSNYSKLNLNDCVIVPQILKLSNSTLTWEKLAGNLCENYSYAKLQQSSVTLQFVVKDFFEQLKDIVGKCYQLLFSLVASWLDPLVAAMLNDYNSTNQNETYYSRLIAALLRKVQLLLKLNGINDLLSIYFLMQVVTRINQLLVSAVLSNKQSHSKKFGSYLQHQIRTIQAATNDMGPEWEVSGCLLGIKQIADVLLLSKKKTLTKAKIQVLCPTLDQEQLHQLCALVISQANQTIQFLGYNKLLRMFGPMPLRLFEVSFAGTVQIGLKIEGAQAQTSYQLLKPIPINILHTANLKQLLKAAHMPYIQQLVDEIAPK